MKNWTKNARTNPQILIPDHNQSDLRSKNLQINYLWSDVRNHVNTVSSHMIWYWYWSELGSKTCKMTVQYSTRSVHTYQPFPQPLSFQGSYRFVTDVVLVRGFLTWISLSAKNALFLQQKCKKYNLVNPELTNQETGRCVTVNFGFGKLTKRILHD